MNVVAEAQHAMTNGHCPLQLGGSGGALSSPVGPGQDPAGGPGSEAPGSSRDPIVYISQKMPKIHLCGPFKPNYNSENFVD